eukprot:TRINITY_DN8885_c0_g1_i2.p1 TRINITY_DN8885_c0_g1~~TRINITY_DN8885_c0_g1_i2.p1  ORF type:complete len:196 (+),score=20.67 TRINITY_DN8885_c0_g1_i2:63-590(+)
MSSVCSDELPPVLLLDSEDEDEIVEITDHIDTPVKEAAVAENYAVAGCAIGQVSGVPLGYGFMPYGMQFAALQAQQLAAMGIPAVQFVPVQMPMMSAPFMGTPVSYPNLDEGSSSGTVSGKSTPPGTNGLNIKAKEFVPKLVRQPLRYPSPSSVVFPTEPVEGVPIVQASYPYKS